MGRPRKRTRDEAAESLAELSENLMEALSLRPAAVQAPIPAASASDARVSQTLAFARTWTGHGPGPNGVMRSLERVLSRPAMPALRVVPSPDGPAAPLAKLAG